MAVKAYEVVVSRGGQELVSVPIDRDRFRVGRSSANDLAVPDESASRFQFEIVAGDGGKLTLLDRSGRGTSVGGKTVLSAEVGQGTSVEIGSYTITVRERTGEEHVEVNGKRKLGSTKRIGRKDSGAAPEGMLLVGTVGGNEVSVVLSPDEPVTIGSSAGNDYVLPDPHVSAFHCRIFNKKGTYCIRDLDSTNGTLVNGTSVVEGKLSVGDSVIIGTTAFRVLSSKGAENPNLITSLDPAMQEALGLVREYALKREPVLITGVILSSRRSNRVQQWRRKTQILAGVRECLLQTMGTTNTTKSSWVFRTKPINDYGVSCSLRRSGGLVCPGINVVVLFTIARVGVAIFIYCLQRNDCF